MINKIAVFTSLTIFMISVQFMNLLNYFSSNDGSSLCDCDACTSAVLPSVSTLLYNELLEANSSEIYVVMFRIVIFMNIVIFFSALKL